VYAKGGVPITFQRKASFMSFSSDATKPCTEEFDDFSLENDQKVTILPHGRQNSLDLSLPDWHYLQMNSHKCLASV
jgi:hypothetical protein